MNIREKALKTLYSLFTDPNYREHGEYEEREVLKAMIEFAHQMCEEQKKECAENAFVSHRITTWDLNPETKERYTDDELKALYKDSNKKLYCKGNGESDLYFVNKSSILAVLNVCQQ